MAFSPSCDVSLQAWMPSNVPIPTSEALSWLAERLNRSRTVAARERQRGRFASRPEDWNGDRRPAFLLLGRALWRRGLVKDFADATFEPEVVEAMTVALQQAIESLAEPISTASID